MIKNFLFSVLLFSVSFAFAQTSNDSVLKHSTVRTLTDEQYNAWLNGTDLKNLAFVAELNHYPLPDKAIRYKKELDLSPAQVTQLNSILKTLRMKKQEVGQSVLQNEQTLDKLFRTRKLDEGSIIFYGNRYGLYEGEYRTALLTACYKTEKILTLPQIKRLEALQKRNQN